MNRLTERDEFGNADIIALSDMMPEIYAELSFSETNALTDAINRLAAYEDTGLEPKEVVQTKLALMGKVLAEIKEFEGIPVDRMIELAQAEKDGRLLVPPPNDPLTLEQLREMDGEVVYITPMKGWAKITKYGLLYFGTADCSLWKEISETYGDAWLAYRRKPDEVTL